MSATLLYACFESEWNVGEQLGVMYDIKSCVVSLDYYTRINFFGFFLLFLKTIVDNAKGSDFYPHSENVWFLCLRTSYGI